ncbi:unnamed protein product [Nyctereutes procyonoides]|uniref:(raccoon dog) hypothetical protein n=1 Tax=Nyctereutes procyonoides TaxID=34880 RepID=A0A811Z000_NYCPR|nr:unnamed protein product [Nyctereutes procyonoides]
MIVTHRERGRGGSRLHAPGAQRGIQSRVFKIGPWAKGRRQTAVPPRDPSTFWPLHTECKERPKRQTVLDWDKDSSQIIILVENRMCPPGLEEREIGSFRNLTSRTVGSQWRREPLFPFTKGCEVIHPSW